MCHTNIYFKWDLFLHTLTHTHTHTHTHKTHDTAQYSLSGGKMLLKFKKKSPTLFFISYPPSCLPFPSVVFIADVKFSPLEAA